MKNSLLADIDAADPAVGENDAELHVAVRRMAYEARLAVLAEVVTQKPWWKRRRAIIPLGIAGVVALSGAALAVPLTMVVNGTQVQPDVDIPINYTTATGVHVSCRYDVYVGDPAHRSASDERLANFLHTHDWDGIGQRIYQRALDDPFVPSPDDHLEVNDQQTRDQFSFTRATNLIFEEMPREFRSAGGATDCSGQLR